MTGCLARQGIQIEEFPQSTPNLTAASQNLYELITGKNLIAYSNPAMRLAVSRAVAIESSRGWRITKEKQSHKIDVVVALAMACHAAIAMGTHERRGAIAVGVPTFGSRLLSPYGMTGGFETDSAWLGRVLINPVL